MKIISVLPLLAVVCHASAALCFDIHTHTAMTTKAVEQSKFGSTPNTSVLLARLGLRDANGIFGNRYVGFGSPLRSRFATDWEEGVMDLVRKRDATLAIPASQTITGWIMRGAVREDDTTSL